MSLPHAVPCPQVEPEDGQKAAGSQGQGPSALETEPVLPENTCTGKEEDFEQV